MYFPIMDIKDISLAVFEYVVLWSREDSWIEFLTEQGGVKSVIVVDQAFRYFARWYVGSV